MNHSETLIQSGFTQGFPFINHFRKSTSEVCSILIDTCYIAKRNDIVVDEIRRVFHFKVTKINLPNSESEVFSKIENALEYTNK